MIAFRKYPALDGIRFFAVSFICIAHMARVSSFNFSSLQDCGFIGVPIFFTLGGFIISSLFLTEYKKTNQIELVKFFLRRILRLWPSWLVSLVITFLYLKFFISDAEVMDRVSAWYWHYLFHFANYSQTYWGSIHFITSHYWFLAVEEHFYIIWAGLFIALVKFPRLRYIVFFIFILLPYVSRLYNYQNSIIDDTTHSMIDTFFYGCILSLLWKRIPAISTIQAHIITFISIVLLLLATKFWFWGGSQYSIFLCSLAYPLVSLATVGIIIVTQKRPSHSLSRMFSSEIFAKAGVLSYGVYLYHMVVQHYIHTFFANKELGVLFVAISFVSSYIPAFLGYVLIERKLEEFKNSKLQGSGLDLDC